MKQNEMEYIVEQLLSSVPEQKQILFNQIEQIRNEGYAVSYGEKTEGTASVAAPIIGFNHKVVGALSVGLISHRINDDRLSFLISKVNKQLMKYQ